MDLNVTRRIPRALWTTKLVREAYHEVLSYRAVMKTLHRIGAILDEPNVKPRKVDPEVIRLHVPTIYHRCVELVLERRLARLVGGRS
jgi:hypothetical protein